MNFYEWKSSKANQNVRSAPESVKCIDAYLNLFLSSIRDILYGGLRKKIQSVFCCMM